MQTSVVFVLNLCLTEATKAFGPGFLPEVFTFQEFPEVSRTETLTRALTIYRTLWRHGTLIKKVTCNLTGQSQNPDSDLGQPGAICFNTSPVIPASQSLLFHHKISGATNRVTPPAANKNYETYNNLLMISVENCLTTKYRLINE